LTYEANKPSYIQYAAQSKAHQKQHRNINGSQTPTKTQIRDQKQNKRNAPTDVQKEKRRATIGAIEERLE